MTSLFISYSRKDIETARKLTEAFKGQNLDFWIDWEGIPPTVDWWKEIERGIERANVFVFLISPDSAKSKVCGQEIDHAVKNGKRLIPVVVRDIKADESPAELQSLNWIFLRENDDFDAGFNKIITAIKTDYAWVQVHGQLQVKALEWERNNRENGFLLHGKELQDAEIQLVANSSKEPHPTNLQREYVLKSRQVTDRQRRTITSLSITGLLIVAALAVYGFVQASLANRRATLARAGELAAESVSLRTSQFDISLLLAIEAFRTADTQRTRGNLLNSAQAKPELTRYLRGYSGFVNSLTFSPDGKTLASAIDNNIILWDIATSRPVGQLLTGHSYSISSLSFSSDGKTLASGGCGSIDSERRLCLQGEIFLWNAITHQPIGQPFTAHTNGVNAVALSPNGMMLASGGGDGNIILWDVVTHQPIGKPVKASKTWVNTVTFSPDGKILASGGCGSIDSKSETCSQGEIILWDVASRERIGQPITGHYDYVNSVAFSPDGTLLASGSDDNYVMLWDVASHQLLGWHGEHADDVLNVAFSPDGKTLFSNSSDDTVVLWDVTTRQRKRQPLAGSSNLVSLAVSPDGNTLASGTVDGSILLWDLSSPPRIGQRILAHKDWVGSVAFSPDGKILASGSCGSLDSEGSCLQGEVIFWDAITHQPIGIPLSGHIDAVRSVAFSPDGKLLVSASCGKLNPNEYYTCVQGEFMQWDVTTQHPIGDPIEAHTDFVNHVVFSPNGKMLATSSNDSTVILWDIATHQPIGQPIAGTNVAFSPDGQTLAAGTNRIITLWDIATAKPIGQPMDEPTGGLLSLHFSPDGKILASGGVGAVVLWDVTTHQPISSPLVAYDGNWTRSLAFSPDGKMLATATSYPSLWDLEASVVEGWTLLGHRGAIGSVAFSPDGKILVSGGGDGTIIFWNLDTETWIESICQRVGRNFTWREWGQYFSNEKYRKTCEQWPLEPEPVSTP